MTSRPEPKGASPTPCPAPGRRVEVEIAGRTWKLDRAADLEELWDAMDGPDMGEDERLPYWTEVWPASVSVARHMVRNKDALAGQDCLDVGCGLGLTAMVAASCGARVTAFDYEPDAVRFAAWNARLNGLDSATGPLWTVMDWRTPAIRPRSFAFIWAGDVLYETKFFDPVIALFRLALAPGGRIWIGEPDRAVARPVWDKVRAAGFEATNIAVEKVALCGQNPTVNLWELTIP